MCLAAICEYLGMKLASDEPQPTAGNEQTGTYYDESYYDIQAQSGAAEMLRRDFDLA